MGALDSATWQALGLILTLVGLALSAVVWARRGPAKGMRGVAWSLLPLAAGLTGVLRLGWEITDAVVGWAARLVFSPVVWLGLVVAGVSLALFVVSGWLLRRTGRPGRKPAEVGRPGGKALPRSERATSGAEPGGGTAGDDMADIEEILRKHGIQ